MKKKNIFFVIGIIGFLVVCILVAGGFFLLRFRLHQIAGQSMYPTLQNGEFYIGFVSSNYYRGEIVVYSTESFSGDLVGRIIGVPGDVVEVKSDELLINDKPESVKYEDLYSSARNVVGFDYLEAGFNYEAIEIDKNNLIELGGNEYLIWGDNRTNSLVNVVSHEEVKDCLLFCYANCK